MDEHAIATECLDLAPLSAEAVAALIAGDRATLERAARARFPEPLQPPPQMEDALPFFLDRLRAQPDAAVWWAPWLLVRRDGRQALGAAGYAGPPTAEGAVLIGYSLYPERQGRGYAGEAVTALVAWALARPGAARVRATIPPWNAASLRVAARAGMRRVGTAADEEAGDVEVWEVAQDRTRA